LSHLNGSANISRQLSKADTRYSKRSGIARVRAGAMRINALLVTNKDSAMVSPKTSSREYLQAIIVLRLVAFFSKVSTH
jgi:hypothetical protein